MTCIHPSPDAELIQLATQLEAIGAQEAALWARADDIADDDLAVEAERFHKITSPIVDRLEALTATTIAGAIAKARAVRWCHHGASITVGADRTMDVRLIESLLADLLAVEAVAA